MKSNIETKNIIETKTKRKGKGKMTVLIIVLAVVAVLSVGGAIGWSFIAKEHNEARNLTLDAVDFSRLKDGTYIGEYAGGMYKWRTNKVQVTVTSGKVSGIKCLSSTEDPAMENTKQNVLYDRVIKVQSLKVDTISGATLTSKAYLKSVEDALLKAEK